MQGLIVIAHGSRRAASNEEVVELAKNLSTKSEDTFTHVNAAFLELATPSLSEAIAEHYAKGIKKITIFPYFLNSGVHMQKDIPALIEQAKQDYLDCEFILTECIGMHKNMPDFILEHIQQ